MYKERIKYSIIYIIKRVTNYLLRIFWIIPIKNNTILFTSFWGKQYSCNPKYICEYIYSLEGNNYEYIWAFKKNVKVQLPEWVKRIEIGSILYYYYRLCVHIIITNCGEYPQIPVRTKQLLINTWHGGGCYKKCGLNQLGANVKGKSYQKLVLMAFKQTDIVLSTNEMSSEKIFRESFGYIGRILNIGYPRNDILIHPLPPKKIRNKICKYISHDISDKVCLYAPTYRDNITTENLGMDYKRLKVALSNRFGGNWTILYRGHHFSENIKEDSCFIDTSDYPDMQELLLLADVLITDYSSAIWDYQLLNRPAFIFATDLLDFKDTRGFYVPIDEWGVSIASDMEQLVSNISSYLAEEATSKYQQAHLRMGDCETGEACAGIYELIKSF